MAHQYARFLEILKKWPVDKARGRHCLGNHLRNSAGLWFTSDGKVLGNVEENTRRLDSLEKLANNHYGKQFSTSHILSATGMNADECSKAISEEFEFLDEGKTKRSVKNIKKEPSLTSVN